MNRDQLEKMLEQEDITSWDGFIFTEKTVEADHILNTSIAHVVYT